MRPLENLVISMHYYVRAKQLWEDFRIVNVDIFFGSSPILRFKNKLVCYVKGAYWETVGNFLKSNISRLNYLVTISLDFV